MSGAALSNAVRFGAILFDLDGTLVDSRADLAHAVNAALVKINLPQRSIEEITGFIGEGSRRLLEKAVAPHEERLAEAHAAWEEAYAAGLLEHTTLYPGMRELVDKLAGLQKLAVHTNKPGKYARPILEGLGVGARFARVLGGGDGSANKPSPEGVRRLLAELDARADEAVYVGDSAIDAQTAAAAGVRFVGVAWGYGGEDQLRAAGATRIVRRTAQDLRKWLVATVAPASPAGRRQRLFGRHTGVRADGRAARGESPINLPVPYITLYDASSCMNCGALRLPDRSWNVTTRTSPTPGQ